MTVAVVRLDDPIYFYQSVTDTIVWMTAINLNNNTKYMNKYISKISLNG